jgi:hypothetical protein
MSPHTKLVTAIFLLLCLCSCTLQLPVASAPCAPEYTSIDAIMGSCPLDCELEAINEDFDILTEEGADFPAYACLEGQDPDGEINPQLALGQLLRAVRALEFDQPLPWTDLSLYGWVQDNISGFVISEGTETYCCDSEGRIVISAGRLSMQLPARWDSPHRNTSLCDLSGDIMHETRHAEIGLGHSCGAKDFLPDEMGPWGTQYHYYVWLVDHTPPGMLTDLQIQCAIAHAQMNLVHYCQP